MPKKQASKLAFFASALFSNITVRQSRAILEKKNAAHISIVLQPSIKESPMICAEENLGDKSLPSIQRPAKIIAHTPRISMGVSHLLIIEKLRSVQEISILENCVYSVSIRLLEKAGSLIYKKALRYNFVFLCRFSRWAL